MWDGFGATRMRLPPSHWQVGPACRSKADHRKNTNRWCPPVDWLAGVIKTDASAPEKTLPPLHSSFLISTPIRTAMSNSSDSSCWDEAAEAESKAPVADMPVEQGKDPDDKLAYCLAVLRSQEDTRGLSTPVPGAASGQCSRWSAPVR